METTAEWTEDKITLLNSCTTYKELAEYAIQELAAMPQPIAEVCGPITTGGLGSVEANLAAFPRAIAYLRKQGKIVFDQCPFEPPMWKIKESSTNPGYAMDLLEEFYLRIFESGYIRELHFLPGWESSFGAKWEHEQAKRLGIDIVYLPADWDQAD